MSVLHVSPFAGRWYPGQAAELERLIEGFEMGGGRVRGEGRAFVVPHAGLEYSGVVAAAAMRELRASAVARVVLLGFLHSGAEAGVVMPDVDEIETPLGRVRVDLTGLPFRRVAAGRACDHSVEMQLPLLQRALAGVSVAPLYVRERGEAARALAGALRAGDVMVASSDLTHYGRRFGFAPFPVDGETRENLRALDGRVMEAMGSGDARFFLEEVRRSGSTMCGTEPVALMLQTLKERGEAELFQEVLAYRTSGEVTGDWGQTVSYGATGFFAAERFGLGEADRAALVETARRTLAQQRETGLERAVTAARRVRARAGVFVSLHERGELMGCIGRLESDQDLDEVVGELALSAVHDPRFEARRSAPEDVEIEISILTPMKRVGAAEAFEVGEHGALLECWGRRGLLLPQVGRRRGATREWFMNALSQKAGLPEMCWREPEARLWIFRAQVFAG